MSSGLDLGDLAHSKAEEIFNLSTECLMSHSVRAVEEYFFRRGRSFSIRIQIRKNFAAKAQSQALAYIFHNMAKIVVDEDIGKEFQRRSIAHELGHIVVAFEELLTTGKLSRRADKYAEDACTIFEKDLCARHHRFNSDDGLRHHQLFPSLADHLLAMQ